MPKTHSELKQARIRVVQKVEKLFLLEALRDSGGNVSEAARHTGMNRTQLQNLLRRHGMSAKTGLHALPDSAAEREGKEPSPGSP